MRFLSIHGKCGVAQVRYPTTIMVSTILNRFIIAAVSVGLAHNGHILNEADVRKALEEKRIYCDSDCDAETILNLFSYYFNQSNQKSVKEKCFESVSKIMNILLGSYSVIAVIRGEGMLVFRDPHGIRPLVYGKSKDCWAFASEKRCN